ncbi:MAG: POTRA domain-containing protein, partial [Bacteroidota bacterium]
AVVGEIVLTGQHQFTAEDVLSRFDTKSGEPLDEAELEQDLDGLLIRYERSGFPLAQCQIASVERRLGTETDSLILTIAIDEGQRVTIDEVQVQGNKETEATVVVRETRLKVGETFNPAKVDAIRQRLQRLNIFSDVSEPEL